MPKVIVKVHLPEDLAKHADLIGSLLARIVGVNVDVHHVDDEAAPVVVAEDSALPAFATREAAVAAGVPPELFDGDGVPSEGDAPPADAPPAWPTGPSFEGPSQ